jgi:hypothetical protein
MLLATRFLLSAENRRFLPRSLLFLLFSALMAAPFCLSLSASELPGSDPAPILEAAESVFQNMVRGDYGALWEGISTRTQRAIVGSVFKALAKAGKPTQEKAIDEDFAQGGKIAQAYWKGYLSRFDPKTALEESRWSMGEVAKSRAIILLRYRKSENDAELKMSFERGGWKVGLYESFHTRE